MKKIITFCLVVGLMIACTEKESVNKEEGRPMNAPSIVYKDKTFRADDPILSSLITPTSITLQFDFENSIRLFDSRSDLQNFLKTNYNGKYSNGVNRVLNASADQDSPNKEEKELGSREKPAKPQNETAKTLNTIYDFELAISDGNCSTYPVQSWYVNLVSNPSGTINSIYTTVGYFALSFDFAVPPGGTLYLNYNGPGWPFTNCLGAYVATSTGCHNPFLATCFRPNASADRVVWSVDIGS